MKIQLSDHFTYGRLFRFVIPSIIMMIFTSLYSMVDGFFVSNYAGKLSFAAVNLIMPFFMILGTIGFMFGAGGSAIVSATLGQKKLELARKYFSMMVYTVIVLGIIIVIIGNIFLERVAVALGASDLTLPYIMIYGRIIIISLPFFMLQNLFQSFLIVAERPHMGLVITLIAGSMNIVLDFLLVGILKMGVKGAAIATVISQILGGGIPFVYFIIRNKSLLRLVPTDIDFKILGKTCVNGSSELLSNISMSVVSMVYNRQLLHFAGEDGVAAYGVIMYAGFIFAAIFIGYSIGVAPLSGYNYGAENHKELHNIFKKSLTVMGVSGIVMVLLSVSLAYPLSSIFVGYDKDLLKLTANGFRIYNLCTLFMGFSIYGSSFFTSLGDGLISALISFLRILVFQLACVIVLPMIFGLNGVWFSGVVAEILSIIVTVTFLIIKQKKYHY